jgi:hypothetical protein
MMCLELEWTTEVGEAFVADQPAVLGAVQRLRQQAVSVGNLQSTPQMEVVTEKQEGQEVVVLKPAKPEVVYVPQYDPVAAYAPAPAATTPATTTAVTEEKSGHSTGTLVTTGVLAFGAGILVNELFDDDDHKNKHKYDYYYPNYGYGGMPYYPPYPYRPAYGGGHYPSHGYNRPPNYNSGWQNNGNIVINTGGNRPNGGYWDRYGNKPGGGYHKPRPVSSPISTARPNRPELNELNKRQPRPMPADYKRPSPNATADNWKGQSGYAGARPGGSRDAKDRIANAQPGYSGPAKAKPATRDAVPARSPPKVQGSYAGAGKDRVKPAATRDLPKPATRDIQKPQTRDLPKPQTRDAARPAPNTRDLPKPTHAKGDRGYAKPVPSARPAAVPQKADRSAAPKPMPTQRPAPSGGNRGTAMSGAKGGKKDMAASQRGKQSLPQGARSKGAGGGGQKKQKR